MYNSLLQVHLRVVGVLSTAAATQMILLRTLAPLALLLGSSFAELLWYLALVTFVYLCYLP